MKINFDLAGVRVGNQGKRFLREINGAAAAGRAVVDYFDHHASPGARVGVALVSGAGARDFVLPIARCPVVPDRVACRRDHHSVIGVAMAG